MFLFRISCIILALNTVTDNEYDVNYNGADQYLLGGFVTIRNIASSPSSRDNKKLSLMKIREKNNFDLFRSFVHYFLRYTVPKKTFTSKRTTHTISTIFTPADEAFCLLCMMNYWDEWELRNSSTGDKKIDKKNRKTYWTNSCNNTTARNMDASNNGDDVYVCGWSVEGRARFNDILVYIVNVRKKRQQKEFERRLMMEYLDEDKSSSRKRKRSNGEVDDELDGESNEIYDMYAIENGDVIGAIDEV